MLERGKMDRDLVEFVAIDQLVPKEHLLRKIDTAVDFTQLYEMVEPLYCEDNGRPSIDPVVLFKMVLIQHPSSPVPILPYLSEKAQLQPDFFDRLRERPHGTLPFDEKALIFKEKKDAKISGK
mgnify:CR=1 FL=1